jgi:hypothetical protein
LELENIERKLKLTRSLVFGQKTINLHEHFHLVLLAAGRNFWHSALFEEKLINGERERVRVDGE